MTHEEAIRKLNITVDLIPAGRSNRPGTRITPTHITIHNTANSDPGANAAMHAGYVKGADARRRKVSWHFTVDDKRVFKHLPSNEKAFHAGSGNGRSVAIEVCENRGIDKAACIDRAALLTAVMMEAYNIPRERVVPHKSWTGKDCPRVLLREPGGFDAFRDRAARWLDELRPAGGSRGLDMGGGMEDAMMDAGADEAFSHGGGMVPGFPPEMMELADLEDAGGMGPDPAEDEAGGDDRIAELERMVGRLALENYNLRRALEESAGVSGAAEPEAP
jgi:hypothetical protein